MINNGRGGVASLVEGTVVTAEFGTDGRVGGSGGCNRFSGEYTLEGDDLAIGPVASTRMACLEPEGVGQQESAYFAALARVASWSFREERLQLRAADGALQAEFRPAP
jgi:putative lipoprotein